MQPETANPIIKTSNTLTFSKERVMVNEACQRVGFEDEFQKINAYPSACEMARCCNNRLTEGQSTIIGRNKRLVQNLMTACFQS